jgi:hypothetical protein
MEDGGQGPVPAAHWALDGRRLGVAMARPWQRVGGEETTGTTTCQTRDTTTCHSKTQHAPVVLRVEEDHGSSEPPVTSEVLLQRVTTGM